MRSKIDKNIRHTPFSLSNRIYIYIYIYIYVCVCVLVHAHAYTHTHTYNHIIHTLKHFMHTPGLNEEKKLRVLYTAELPTCMCNCIVFTLNMCSKQISMLYHLCTINMFSKQISMIFPSYTQNALFNYISMLLLICYKYLLHLDVYA